MGIFDKFQNLAATRQQLEALGINPFGVQIEKIISPTEGVIHGRPTILAGTNNYLGLTFDPDCIAAARTALEHEGTGTTGSRMANGSYSGHRKLEQEIAGFYGKSDGIVFSTGYQANLGMLSALAGPDDVVLLDADCHASIYDGCRLGGAEIIRFRHNNPEDLAKRMRRLGKRAADALILVEGIYSMLGDRAPLKEIVDVKREFGGYLMIDEAHSLGVLGEKGCGLVEELGLLDDADFIVGTFSKSLGGAGGFCVSSVPELELIRYSSRPYIFTASPSPATIASTRCALHKLEAGTHLRRRLHDNAQRLHDGLSALGYKLGAPPSPVIAVVIDGVAEALQFWNNLLQRGVYVNLMLPPATPDGVSLIRCSLSAAHTTEQIDAVCAAFAELRAQA
ncbi:MAG: aminotransferase class I/II-fold pyridoxal phosphate-dependent enzyme [Gallionella sp.]|nr:aminotransferase class I/II-fold pyridoxal phosphate-dependent enzyme [Gallionella sp.]OIO10022.1 MAG: 8-amino-7-oxononanoate synthase [Gallionellaceae bacterium CG1_02_60_325]PIR09085.1 MAG: 8-amino-7-oxononanoate synthase [Gallionellaceae bacterium CG11_big_fil_rev_8_21_14_0_20_60_62]PIV47796.1 MAG: 8-amino-7-oxononanoate synthase [Gallionellaceae bacterium CG02_land_8_20_14_3_00_60_115]PJC05427.1 MAG: 8-amino-7-oxononanoate synthase [Gallionellaceae bacterium CG_4_9_14_0_8_um_filter_60_33